MKRKISKDKYLLSAFITAVIFLLGFSIGLVVEGKRAILVDDLLGEQKVEFSSSQLQYDYISGLDSKESCPAIFRTFYTNLKNLDQTRIRLETYALDSKINDHTIAMMRRLKSNGKTNKQIAAQCEVGMTSVRTYTLGVQPERVAPARQLKGMVRSIKGVLLGKSGRLLRQVNGGDGFLGYSLVKMEKGEEWIITDWLVKA